MSLQSDEMASRFGLCPWTVVWSPCSKVCVKSNVLSQPVFVV